MIHLISTRPSLRTNDWFDEIQLEKLKLVERPTYKFESIPRQSSKKYKWGMLSSPQSVTELNREELESVENWFCVGSKTAYQLKTSRINPVYVSNAKGMNNLLKELGETKEFQIEIDEPIWYPCSKESTLESLVVLKEFKLKVIKEPIYQLVSTQVKFSDIKETKNIWVHFSGGAVRHLVGQIPPENHQKIKSELHIAWGMTAKKELEKENFKHSFIDSSQEQSKWVKCVEKEIREAVKYDDK
jgi:uroporphyrinogen-III synthase